QRGQQIGVLELHALRFFNLWPELLPRLVQSACVHLARDEEMGDRRPALGCALRHQPGNWTAAVNRSGRRAALGFRSRENIGCEDFSAGPRSADIREMDAELAGEAPRFGGN